MMIELASAFASSTAALVLIFHQRSLKSAKDTGMNHVPD